ncbi:hypothetical protein CIG75_02320 [Tumebacillus algifaecis]|uniref:Uncharacterized protein n=1 Tax=Tumebacillus algifaecis TaxID=1214604 RepID=A0A223CX94_9BACL|nr:hypothetical protein CIG75_02320 [Tumebacillus algifaecis]
MTRRGIGFGFCLIAAILIATKYLSAAIYSTSSSSSEHGSDAFQFWLDSVDHSLTLLSVSALLIGIAYIIWAEWIDRKQKI